MKFKLGATVYHTTKKSYGIVEQAFVSNLVDGRVCEYRYYVRHGGYLHSVPERALIHKKRADNSRMPKVAKSFMGLQK